MRRDATTFMRGKLFLLALSCGLATCMPRPDPAAVTPPGTARGGGKPSELVPGPLLAMPRPYRKRLEAAALLNATCVSCHEDEAVEWRGSLHQRAHTNTAFQSALAVEPTPFCRGCHAPESDPMTTPSQTVSELGVGCVTCHVTGDDDDRGAVVVLAAPSSREGASSAAPHSVRRSNELGQTGGCAGCHEFRFPGAPSDEDRHLMQTTLREHEGSPASAKACASCHMPMPQGKRGRRSHAFAEVRDASWLKENLRTKAERVLVSDESGAPTPILRITLTQPAPGHAFPTGDLFRRLEVGFELRDKNGTVLRREVRHLARHFEVVPGEHGRQLVRDDRVFDTPRVIELAVPVRPASWRSSSTVVVWWVTYQRVASVGTGAQTVDAMIESEVPLHAGTFPWGDEVK